MMDIKDIQEAARRYTESTPVLATSPKESVEKAFWAGVGWCQAAADKKESAVPMCWQAGCTKRVLTQEDEGEEASVPVLTPEEAEREMLFVREFASIKGRTPTFNDCIELTQNIMADYFCIWLREYDGSDYDRDDILGMLRGVQEDLLEDNDLTEQNIEE